MKLIGISGPSGSGKTSLCSLLVTALPNSNIIHQDWYFRTPEELGDQTNFAELSCLYLERFIADITALYAGKAVEIPELDLKTFERTDRIIVIKPAEYIIVEGMTIYRILEIVPLFTTSIYLDPGTEEIKRRKLQRDQIERARSPEETLEQLAWVIEEYKRDFAIIPTSVYRLRGNIDLQTTCGQVLEIIHNKTDK